MTSLRGKYPGGTTDDHFFMRLYLRFSAHCSQTHFGRRDRQYSVFSALIPWENASGIEQVQSSLPPQESNKFAVARCYSLEQASRLLGNRPRKEVFSLGCGSGAMQCYLSNNTLPGMFTQKENKLFFVCPSFVLFVELPGVF